MHLPGHSPGSIALHDRAARILFTGDAVYDELLLDTAHGSSIPDYVRSMRRLLELDVATAHGGHAASFGGDRLGEIAEHYLQRRTAAGDRGLRRSGRRSEQ